MCRSVREGVWVRGVTCLRLVSCAATSPRHASPARQSTTKKTKPRLTPLRATPPPYPSAHPMHDASTQDSAARSILDQVDHYLNERDFYATHAAHAVDRVRDDATPEHQHEDGCVVPTTTSATTSTSRHATLSPTNPPWGMPEGMPDPLHGHDRELEFQLEFDLLDAHHDPPHGVHVDNGAFGAGVAFSPAVSPMVVPAFPSKTATPYVLPGVPHSLSSSSSRTDAHRQFSPLTSPALTASDKSLAGGSSYQRSLSYWGSNGKGQDDALPPPSQTHSSRYSSSSSRGKRTPLSTPALTATTSATSTGTAASSTASRVVKQSPQISSHRKSLSTKIKTNWDDMFALPASSIPPERARSSSASSSGASNPDAPPDPDELRVAPSAVMATFPKVILPSNFSTKRSASPSHEDRNVLLATDSPVIRPKHPSAHLSRNASAGSIHTRATPELKPTPRASKPPVADAGWDEDDHTKKEIHKAAEQGRRNRLNVALLELHSLIPNEFKESVSIPSKATTVELACKYIRHLTGKPDDDDP
ncbi:LAMI_0B04544g1_1 [Lachancea mirantina]|uniref:LAMI_0B04544g1_1 n=1 Tax=Lachancea mirantina TaxID=1230905 RepID=A0A1G4IVM0_9SACH|nr:LAMI_0B04544g1_1 [Lachancea mirantina]